MMRKAARWPAILLIGFVIVATAPAAFASPPDNDNFVDAAVVSSLPFADSGDLAGMSSEPDEPSHACLPMPAPTVWYLYTAPTSGHIRVDLGGSGIPVSVVAYQSSGGGFGGLTLAGCGGALSPLVLAVAAESTYYLQVGMFTSGPTHMALTISEVPPPPNDNFADATPLAGAPVSATVDLTAATLEPGEPAPGGRPVVASGWYSYTAAADGTLLVRAQPDPGRVLGVYTGSSLSGVTEVASGAGAPPLAFSAEAGRTYYLQVADAVFPPSLSKLANFTIDWAGPVFPGFVSFPSDPSIYDIVQFIDTSFDPAFIGFGPAQWDLGDGTTASGCCPSHRYGADGDYLVTLTATTLDGRTASTSQTVTVRTHDVSVERIQAPNSARANQTKDVSVRVRGGAYPETVRIDLYKSTTGLFDELVATKTLAVPPATGSRSTTFEFSYTFTFQDAEVGKVTFRAVAMILGARDALPADNQAIAPPTEVKR
jgi:hypothetical protein